MKTPLVFDYEYFKVDEAGSITNKYLGKSQGISEIIDSDIEITTLQIKSGTFMMGSMSEEFNSDESERPKHQVTISSFYMSKYPITQLQWRNIMGYNPSYYQGDLLPVEQVSWFEATDFCSIISEKTGSRYRLPSESEWEYACRSGTNSPFYCGDNITTQIVNYNGNFPYHNFKKEYFLDRTTEVGTFPPNAWGLYDMHGNIHEWCSDDWHDNYLNAPVDGTSWSDSPATITSKSLKVIRGGSKGAFARCCRSSSRDEHSAGSKSRLIGFRVVCDHA